MTYVAQRTCALVNENEPQRRPETSAAPLENFAATTAYVLIGKPGAGKTTAFKCEAGAHEGLTSLSL